MHEQRHTIKSLVKNHIYIIKYLLSCNQQNHWILPWQPPTFNRSMQHYADRSTPCTPSVVQHQLCLLHNPWKPSSGPAAFLSPSYEFKVIWISDELAAQCSVSVQIYIHVFTFWKCNDFCNVVGVALVNFLTYIKKCILMFMMVFWPLFTRDAAIVDFAKFWKPILSVDVGNW